MVGAVLVGTAVLVASSTGLLLAAAAASDWLNPDASKTEQAAAIALYAVALAIAATSLLLVIGYASRTNVALSCVALGAFALRLRGRRAIVRLSSCAHAGLDALQRSPVLWLLPAFSMFVIARGLALPPLAWDGLSYHLTYPATWIQHAGIVRFEAGGIWEAYETFPKGGEALFFFAMLPFHGDALVNVANLPLWFGMTIAVRACAQRLGVRPSLQDGCAVVVGLCPAFSAYITPAYVELGSAFAFAAGLSLALRTLRGDARAHFGMWLALGVAIAVKITALALIGGALLVTLFGARGDPRTTARWSSRGALVALFVCGPWFLQNAIACGNPFYPAALPGFTHGAFAGSELLRWTLGESSILSQAAGSQLLDVLLAPPWRNHPLGPAALYPIALLLPFVALPACPSPQRRSVLVLLALAFALLAVYLISPWNGIYVDANTRFLGCSFIAAALANAVTFEELPKAWRLAAAGTALSLALAYLARVSAMADVQWHAPSLWTAMLSGTALALLVGSSVSAPSARTQRVAAALCALAAVAALPQTLAWREQQRLTSYEHSYDLHPVPNASKDMWPTIERLPSSRIALAVGGIDTNEGWFFYPLFGSALQHDVRYIDVEADGELRSCARRGMIRDRPDYAAWQRRLLAQKIDYLLVHGGPLEARWAEAHPERFVPAATGPYSSLFRINKPAE